MTLDNRGQRALVTGASGQLGALLASRLVKEGLRVRVILRPGSSHSMLKTADLEVVRGSFADPNVQRDALQDCHSVFHVAGVVSYRRAMDAEVYRINVGASVSLFEAAVTAGVSSFVLTSSTMSVGSRDGAPAASESDPFPADLYDVPYADSKRLAERYVLAGASRTRCVAVCPSTIVGPGEKLGNYARLFRLARQGRLRFAPPGGIGFVDVADAVEGHVLAFRNGVTGTRYILNTANAPFQDVFAAINTAVGSPHVPVVMPASMLRSIRSCLRFACAIGVPVETAYRAIHLATSRRYFNADRAQRELGWVPRYSLLDSMRRASESTAKT